LLTTALLLSDVEVNDLQGHQRELAILLKHYKMSRLFGVAYQTLQLYANDFLI
jgi:hypothetical protein